MTTGAEESPQIATPAAEPEANPFQRIAGVFITPVRTFAEIARKPDILVPLILILALGYGGTFATAPRLDWDAMKEEQVDQIRKAQPQMTADDAERAANIGASIGKVTIWIAPLLGVVWYLIVAGVLLLAFRLLGGEGGFRQAFSVTLYAWLPYVVLGVITAVVIVAKGSVSPTLVPTLVKSNPGFLVDPKQQVVLFSALSALDVFTFWVLALLSIGFASVSKFSKAKAAAVVIPLWLVLFVIRLGFAAMGAAKMKG